MELSVTPLYLPEHQVTTGALGKLHWGSVGNQIRVGWKSVEVNERDLKIRSPRPSYLDYSPSIVNHAQDPYRYLFEFSV